MFMEDLPEDQQDVSGMGKYGAGEQTTSCPLCARTETHLQVNMHFKGSAQCSATWTISALEAKLQVCEIWGTHAT